MGKIYYKKHDSSMDLAIAYNMYYGIGEIEYSELPWNQKEGEKVLYLPSDHINQEQLLQKKEALNSLSKEAKEVIKLVLDCPGEILQLITTSKTGNFSLVRIKRYFKRHKKWTDRTIKRAFREITAYIDAV